MTNPSDKDYQLTVTQTLVASNDGDAVAMFLDQLASGLTDISITRDAAQDSDPAQRAMKRASAARVITKAADAMSPGQRARLAHWIMPDPETLSAHDRRRAAARLETLRARYLDPDAAS